MAEKWKKDVIFAFAEGSLQDRILEAAQRHQGELPALFGDIANYVLSTAPSTIQNSKKRKLECSSQPPRPATNGTAHATAITKPKISFECKNVSFQVPARKKLKLEIAADPFNLSRTDIQLVDPKTSQVEYTLSNTQIDQVFCLPVPEKQQRQWNFCVFPQPGATTAEGLPCEQMVFTLNETKPVDAISSSRTATDEDNYVTFTEPELNKLLQAYSKRVVRPTETEFASSIPQSHRKGEKAYHVKAHRGTKEGYLFFLSNGVVFGFKKPLAFFPFPAIESISYTSVLQRTFNLVIAATEGDGTEVKEIEFSMLDQADFSGIDEYVKRHGLNDASMAADRKAKAYNTNKEVKAETNGSAAHAEGEDEQSELQKAEQQLQDEEDELEEDYEASGGESDGEGEYSENESGDGEEFGEDGDGEMEDDMEHDADD